MTWLVKLALLAYASGKWTEIQDIYQNKVTFSVQELYVDQETGDHHILFGNPYAKYLHYRKMNKNFEVLANTTFRYDKAFFATAHIRKGENNKILYIVFECDIYINRFYQYFEQLVAVSENGGETWSDMTPVPHVHDRCSRFGSALLPIKETGDWVWLYYSKCVAANDKICISVKKKSEKQFSEEKVIYIPDTHEIFTLSFIAEYTVDNNTPVIHLFWFGKKDYDTPLHYMQSRDIGKTFSEPIRISPKTHVFTGYLSLDSVTNLQSSQIIVGTYPISPYNSLQMFYSKDHGKTFQFVDATEGHKIFFTWSYRTNAMTINGLASAPKLAMLTQLSKDIIEFGIWDLKSMAVQRDHDHPFVKIQTASGVSVGSYCDSGKMVITAIVSEQKEDKLYHMLVAQNILSIQH